MINIKKTFFSYTGRQITLDEGTLGLLDIAIPLGRICRYGGGSRIFWPVLLHSLVVADLVPKRLEAHGLLHDMTDAIFGDIPTPFKTDAMRALQHRMHDRFLGAFGLSLLNAKDRRQIKRADVRAFVGEQVVAPPGRAEAIGRDLRAEQLTVAYRQRYTIADCVEADGRAVLDFIVRTHLAVQRGK